VDDDCGAIQRFFEEALISLELERVRHEPSRVGDGAVQTGDRKAFDAKGSAHSPIFPRFTTLELAPGAGSR
jgi:hypothetical protein